MNINGLNGQQVEFEPGQIIFNEGDSGGDLFCIKEGKVEIFRRSGGLSAQLAILGPGDVLGIMTCLTREPRLASARTLTKVKALLVKQGGFKSLISDMPPWVHSVIKDFTSRIKHMDDIYMKLMVQAQQQQMDCAAIQLGSIVAFGLSAVGAMQVDSQTEKKVIDVDQALGTLGKVTGVEKHILSKIFETFLAVGILKAEPHAVIRRAEISVLERLSAFGNFAQRFLKSSDIRKGVSQSTPGDRQLIIKICDFIRTRKPPFTPLPTGEIKIGYSEILPVITDKESLELAVKRHEFLNSLHMTSEDPNTQNKDQDSRSLTFIPGLLISQIRSIDAIVKLLDIDRAAQPKIAPTTVGINEHWLERNTAS